MKTEKITLDTVSRHIKKEIARIDDSEWTAKMLLQINNKINTTEGHMYVKKMKTRRMK